MLHQQLVEWKENKNYHAAAEGGYVVALHVGSASKACHR